jgi:predicted enzyme related to lactoylglutathione lyase
MPDQSHTTDPGVEAAIARPGGISYLQLPARDVVESAHFYGATFGWRVEDDPESSGFHDGTGHVIGRWHTHQPAAKDSGIIPYIYVEDLESTLQLAEQNGARIVTPAYLEGSLKIATILDPADNLIGVWQQGPR